MVLLGIVGARHRRPATAQDAQDKQAKRLHGSLTICNTSNANGRCSSLLYLMRMARTSLLLNSRSLSGAKQLTGKRSVVSMVFVRPGDRAKGRGTPPTSSES